MLIIVLHADDGTYWKLKADINLLTATEAYVEGFDPATLTPCVIGATTAMADILWVASDGVSGAKIQQRQQLDALWAKMEHDA